ncbi:hypothetical protein ACT3CD_06270 [Geofilum sp. OHC36d9]|uniref:hypothetical protein n=1 Tax=Geofilum sp. OHC36d9 TaxID=3458413 RepID=UPI004033B495
MTKKFLEAYLDKKNKRTRKREFIIPDIFNLQNSFIGIETKKEYSHGIICFTGVVLDSKTVIDRLIENKIIQKTQNDYIATIDKYLTDLKDFKISNIITIEYIDNNFRLIKSDMKRRIIKNKLP